MSRKPRASRALAVVGVAAAMVAGATGVPARGETLRLGGVDDTKGSTDVYIVQLAEEPVASYRGGRPGLAATKPQPGAKINPNSAPVRRYAQFLDGRHAAVLADAGVAAEARFYDYRYSYNGFAAELTPAQVARLRAMPGVVHVAADVLRRPQTDNTPGFLGLPGPGGLWGQLGGQGAAGEDVIVGVVDTGIWPEHPSFSDQADLIHRPGKKGKALQVYDAPTGWFGTCQSGERWSKDLCNNKLIGARYFLAGFGRHFIIDEDYKSARDADGHGTHTASTAAGNGGVTATILSGQSVPVSGIAPRARVAAYKVCWSDDGCALTDMVAGIDAAVADGVDVINFSIGSEIPGLLDPDAVAFLAAADAGVFAATSAGNSGPGAATIGSPGDAPWVTTVAASTHSRRFEGTVVLGDATTLTGASVTAGTATLPLVDGAGAARPGIDAADAELCLPGTLDPAAVAGRIVLCLRGTNARTEKSQAVLAAGGAGMVLANATPAEDTTTDNHYVPTVNLDFDDGMAVRDYLAGAGGTAAARLTAGTPAVDPAAPAMAGFSSRGPNRSSFDVIKPDLTAPGVQILAGTTPTPFPGVGKPGQLFQAISGTSMASPHVAGAAALLLQAHPQWTPAMVRSALMTTAGQDVTKHDGVTPADPFDFGAGHLTPTPAAGPGLVYNAGFDDYARFLCGRGTLPAGHSLCTSLGGIDPSDLNLPSIGVDGLAGIQTVTRTVTNVGPAATYSASVDAPAGIDVVVDPPTLTLAAGQRATYQVTFTATPAVAFHDWAFGSLTWADGAGHRVRSPLAVRPVPLVFPSRFGGTGTAGTGQYPVKFGYTGPFAADVRGLVAADTQTATVADDPSNDIDTALESGVGVHVHAVAVPAGTRDLRLALFDEDTDGADDLDLYLFNPAGQFTFRSNRLGSDEELDISNPAAGTWHVVVHGFETDGPDAHYTLFSWLLDDTAQTNLTVTAPPTATVGQTGTVELAWSGLVAGRRYLGTVSYNNGFSFLGTTVIAITP